MSEAAQIAKSSSRIKAFFLVVLIFAVLGPAVGGLLFGIVAGLLAASANSGGESATTIVWGYFLFLLLSMLFSYLFGMPHALIAGAIVAAAGIRKQWNHVFVAIIAGAIASVVGTVVLQINQLHLFYAPGILWFMPSSIVAALVCWYFTRGIIKATWPNGAEPAR